MTIEREFGPDEDQRDSDHVIGEAGDVAGAAREAALDTCQHGRSYAECTICFKKKPARRREIYMSSRVFRDGEPVELHEVLWVEEPENEVPVETLTPGQYEAPDRARFPYQWEQFWRQMMRKGPPTGRWRAGAPDEIKWHCEWCGRPMDVKSKGRPPKFHAKCRMPAWRAAQTRVEQV